MQLTRFSDLSLRLLLYLASRDHPLDASVTARTVSALFNVPYAHMVKVVHQLGRLDLIVTTKGKGGGLRLARAPGTIRLGEVLRQTEPQGAVIDCFTQPCPLRFECGLKHALDDAYEAFFRELDKLTLDDLSTMPALQRLVQIEQA